MENRGNQGLVLSWFVLQLNGGEKLMWGIEVVASLSNNKGWLGEKSGTFA
jgi:hypothetical protein